MFPSESLKDLHNSLEQDYIHFHMLQGEPAGKAAEYAFEET